MLSKLMQLVTKKRNKTEAKGTKVKASLKKDNDHKAVRKGELGEYKVNIQLDQMPKEYKHLADVLLPNPKAKSGYSQIDHILLTPYAIFIIETKNYAGEIKGGKEDKQWTVNNRFKMMNPFYQNYGHVESIRKLIQVGREDIVSLVSFTRRCTFRVDPELRKIGSNELIVYDIELTEFIHRKINRIRELKMEQRFSFEQIKNIYDDLSSKNITDPMERKRHVESLNREVSNPVSPSNEQVDHKCFICGKSVTDKIAAFCLSNQARFKGNVYCFEHQKSL